MSAFSIHAILQAATACLHHGSDIAAHTNNLQRAHQESTEEEPR
jgi:hypothetical protein